MEKFLEVSHQIGIGLPCPAALLSDDDFALLPITRFMGPPGSWPTCGIKDLRRELIEPHKGDERYARRNATGQFKEMDDVGRSLGQNRRTKAKTVAKPSQGDRGDAPARRRAKR